MNWHSLHVHWAVASSEGRRRDVCDFVEYDVEKTAFKCYVNRMMFVRNGPLRHAHQV